MHRTVHTVAFSMTEVADFIEPPNWPSDSPDLNLIDYSIWGDLQQPVYCQKLKDIEQLKQVLNSGWDMISQELIYGAIDLNECCWSFLLKVNTLSAVYLNSVTFACCRLYSCEALR